MAGARAGLNTFGRRRDDSEGFTSGVRKGVAAAVVFTLSSSKTIGEVGWPRYADPQQHSPLTLRSRRYLSDLRGS